MTTYPPYSQFVTGDGGSIVLPSGNPLDGMALISDDGRTFREVRLLGVHVVDNELQEGGFNTEDSDAGGSGDETYIVDPLQRSGSVDVGNTIAWYASSATYDGRIYRLRRAPLDPEHTQIAPFPSGE